MSQTEINHCCYCGDECNPCSQACGKCMRQYTFREPRDIIYYSSPSPYNHDDVQEIIEKMKELSDEQRLEIISQFCSFSGKVVK